MIVYNCNKEKGYLKMNKNDLMDKLDELVEMLGTDTAINELAKAMDSNELENDLKYIDRMHDLNLFDED